MNFQKIIDDSNIALKNKDVIRRQVLTSLISNIKKYAIDNGIRDNITEEVVNTVVLKEVKTLQEQIDTCPKDRISILEIYNEKLNILKEYAPVIMNNEEEIYEYIINMFEGITLSKNNKREYLPKIMSSLKGKADLKVVNKVLNGRIFI